MKLIEGGLIIPLIRYHLYFGKLILATAAIFRSSHEFPASPSDGINRRSGSDMTFCKVSYGFHVKMDYNTI